MATSDVERVRRGAALRRTRPRLAVLSAVRAHPHAAGVPIIVSRSRVGDDHHHHIVCRSRVVIADVDCAVGGAPCLTASDHLGCSADEAGVTDREVCASRVAAPAPS
ncbi:transcriptional repressor [Micromonospora echinaurantiaca]